MGQLGRFRRQLGGTRHRPPACPIGAKDRRGSSDRIEMDQAEIEAILERAKTALSGEEHAKLQAAIETLLFLTQELEKKHVSIQKLKQMLFGASTESTRKVLEKFLDSDKPPSEVGKTPEKSAPSPPPKPPGHGRNGADAYSGAETVHVKLESLKPGDPCPNCHKGTVYTTTPSRWVRIRGQAPQTAAVQ